MIFAHLKASLGKLMAKSLINADHLDMWTYVLCFELPPLCVGTAQSKLRTWPQTTRSLVPSS